MSKRPVHIHFLPWRGRAFGERFRRLLVLGESHYDDDDEGPLFTRTLTRKYVTGSLNHRFWTQIAQVVTGSSHQHINRLEFWNDISFYNYVQEIAVSGPRQAPPAAAFHRSEPAFWETLDIIRPAWLLALGNRLWSNMPALDDETLFSTFGGERRQYGFYSRPWGKVAAISIQHPSSAFSAARWHPVITDFMLRVVEQPGDVSPATLPSQRTHATRLAPRA